MFAVNDLVAYAGRDIPEISAWEGHPGVVIDVHATGESTVIEVTVDFVGSGSLAMPPADVEGITRAVYLERGERVLKCLHPLRDERISAPLTAEESHWPDEC